MRFLYLTIFFLNICLTSLFATTKVLVTIAPAKFLVEKIAQDKVQVMQLVPSAASPHSYEPNLKQITQANEAQIWFTSGEGLELKAIKVFQNKMIIQDLRENLNLISFSSHCGCKHDDFDSHTWLSPRNLMIQADLICQILTQEIPQEAAFFQKNRNNLVEELIELDKEIIKKTQDVSNRTILVSHPAFGYFCRDYYFEQLSIEVDGKEPTIKEVSLLIKEIQQKNIRKIIVEPQYTKKGAQTLAKELKLAIYEIDPYEENVIYNLKKIATVFSE